MAVPDYVCNLLLLNNSSANTGRKQSRPELDVDAVAPVAINIVDPNHAIMTSAFKSYMWLALAQVIIYATSIILSQIGVCS